MGGTGFSLKVKAIRGAEATPEKLYDELYAIIEDNIRRTAKGKPYMQVTEDFLSIAHEDGAGRAGAIEFGFRDGAGLCQASVHACNHWFYLFVAALARPKGKGASPLAEIAERHGLALAGRAPDFKKLIKTCEEPLVELRGHLFGIGRDGRKPYLVSDELDDDRIELEDLEPKERAKVTALVKKKRCECKVCAALRKSATVTLPKPKKAKKAKKPPKLGVKTTLSSDKTHRNIYDDTCTALPDGVFQPLTLTGLHVHAPVTTIPDGLAALTALKKVALYSTKVARLPEVLTRMPQVIDLWIAHSPFEAPSDLDRMPWLEALRLEALPMVKGKTNEIPFASFTKLQRLQLDWLDLGAIPVEALHPSLREIVIFDRTITALPEELLANDRLEALSLYYVGIAKLPSLVRMTKLRELTLTGEVLVALDELPPNLEKLRIDCSNLETLPESIGDLARLEQLDINAKLTTLPAAFAKLTTLRELSFTAPVVRELPREIGRLDGLRRLMLVTPALETIPEDALPRGLTMLHLYQCAELRNLPESIGDLSSLTEIDITAPKLAALPRTMRKLAKLESLSLVGSEHVTEIPSWVGDLRALTYLRFEDCPKITVLPEALRRLGTLTRICLSGMPAVFPLPKWINELPLEVVYTPRSKVSKEERARLQKLLPATKILTR